MKHLMDLKLSDLSIADHNWTESKYVFDQWNIQSLYVVVKECAFVQCDDFKLKNSCSKDNMLTNNKTCCKKT